MHSEMPRTYGSTTKPLEVSVVVDGSNDPW